MEPEDFDIDVVEVTEHEDGSCTLACNLSTEATRWLLETALQKVLMDAVNALEQETKDAS